MIRPLTPEQSWRLMVTNAVDRGEILPLPDNCPELTHEQRRNWSDIVRDRVQRGEAPLTPDEWLQQSEAKQSAMTRKQTTVDALNEHRRQQAQQRQSDREQLQAELEENLKSYFDTAPPVEEIPEKQGTPAERLNQHRQQRNGGNDAA